MQDQLNQMKRENFNGVELFATEEEWQTMEGLNKSHLKINGQDVNDGSDALMELLVIWVLRKSMSTLIIPMLRTGLSVSMISTSSNSTPTQLGKNRTET